MKRVFSFLTAMFLLCSFAYATDDAVSGRGTASQGTARSQSTSTSERDENMRSQSASAAERGDDTKTRAAVTRRVVTPQSATRQTATRGNVVQRAAVAGKVVSSPVAQRISARTINASRPSMTSSRAAVKPMISSTATRATANAARGAVRANRSRAAVTGVVGKTINSKYVTCKTTYFSCMDEFCANKDSTLRRCACSARLHDFDDDKKALKEAQDKITDFNKRLLAVNMDKEDAKAMVNSTEGEDAANTADNSASQAALNEIMNKINSTTTDTQQTQTLAAINLSTSSGTTNIFDSVDSTLGSTTATKEGDALYRAALPSCLEMAKEVCDVDDIPIIQSAYTMAIEQDCNTLEKNYTSLKDTVLGKAQEGSALLDMSRLTNYQDRNSGDVLTCTKQMMDVITTDSVCGSDLGKCMDWSGKYIDPSTGQAILTENIANLADILVRPTNDQKWANVPANQQMVQFLGTKKTYIEPAMANCESIQETVWDNFIETALSQIKIAQDKRLEDMRQNCTTLIGQCKLDTTESIEDFDQRALSIFGVLANTAVDKMCSDIETACTALMLKSKQLDDTTTSDGNSQTGEDWSEGMENMDAQKTYALILQNCRIVGQECISQQCGTENSQFELCNEETSSQRRNILNSGLGRNYCYNQVLSCVNDATTTDFTRIETNNPNDFVDTLGTFYDSTDTTQIKIAKNIWGRCTNKRPFDKNNRIDMTKDTLLAWLGTNTTISCYTGSCPDDTYYFYSTYDENAQEWDGECGIQGSSGYELCTLGSGLEMGAGGAIKQIPDPETGVLEEDYSTIIQIHTHTNNLPSLQIYVPLEENTGYFTNCCFSMVKDGYGNCCETSNGNRMNPVDNLGIANVPITMPSQPSGFCDPTRQCCFEMDRDNPTDTAEYGGNTAEGRTVDNQYCRPTGLNWNYMATNGSLHLFCLGTLYRDKYGISDGDKTCDGTFVTVNPTGIYRSKLTTGTIGLNMGTEKYMNYFYDNASNVGADPDAHHRLFMYLPANFFGDGAPAADGFYNITSDGTATVYDQPTAFLPPLNLSLIKHKVAYCENGFKIRAEQEAFVCCESTENCKAYKVE